MKNLFENYILLFLFTYAFLHSKEKNLDKFLEQKKESLNGIIELFNLKYKIFFLLFNEEENFNINDEEIIKSLKNNKNIKDIINKSNNLLLRAQNLEIPQFHIISLPDTFIELFAKYMNISCDICRKNRASFYICLFCGQKICDSTSCLIESKTNGKKEYSLFQHSKNCSGGNCLFLYNEKSELIYSLKRQYFNSDIYVYLNSFGEYLNNDLNESYVLNKVELEKGIQNYIDMTYRKNKFKLNYS